MGGAPVAEAVIDLDAYRHNLRTLAKVAAGAEVMAVVKADAYGHGVIQCARAAREAGVAWLGVATLQEALALRAAGDAGRVLTWLAPLGADFATAIEQDVDVTAASADQLGEILSAPSTRRPRVHLKVDTGMSRNGVAGADLDELVRAAAIAHSAGSAEIVGIFSHLACADEPADPSVDRQERAFLEAVDQLRAAGVEPQLRHLANSAATLTRPSAHLDLVRVGIASYGLSPAPAVGSAADFALRPVMTLRSSLALVKQVPAGSGISYGHTYVTDRDTTLGLVPVGYGDGVLRSLSNRADVWTAGGRRPLRGRVCMDQLVVDLADAQARRGDRVVLFGPGEDGEPTAQDWAEAAGTISYEIVTRLGGRITRTHVGD